MTFPTTKSDPYKKGARKKAKRAALWTDKQWAQLVKLASDDDDDTGDDARLAKLAKVPPAIPVKCLRLIQDLCSALADAD